MAFSVEEIEDNDKLLSHVHLNMWVGVIPNKRPSSACFKDRLKLSVNWIKYSSVAHTRRPTSGAVVSFMAEKCRDLGQKVVHSPLEPEVRFGPNRAHSDIEGNKDQELADKLAILAFREWSID